MDTIQEQHAVPFITTQKNSRGGRSAPGLRKICYCKKSRRLCQKYPLDYLVLYDNTLPYPKNVTTDNNINN